MRKREENDVKESGYVWLGEIPKNWKVVDFKYLFNICKQISTEKDPVVLSLGMSGVKIRDTSNNEGQLAASYENYALIKKGQFALNPMDLISGAVAISPYEGVMSNAYKIFTQEGSQYGIMMNPEYYEYLLRYHYDNKVFLPFGKGVGRSESGGGRWTLNTETLNNFPMLLPPLEEQQRIAAFLDAETGKVDNLVDELTKFKTQLQTQRKSLISECVTKGVPEYRDREYKDSGVEWLGEIPAGWELRPFGKSVRLANKKVKATSNRISLDMIQSGSGIIMHNEENDFVGDGIEFSQGDVLFGKLRPYLNKSYYAASDGDAFGDIHVYKPNQDVNGKYLFYFTLSDGFVKEANRTASGVKMPRASWSNIAKFPFIIPPPYEQQKIADYLDAETAKIDSLIGDIDNQVNLLKTYRKSLINEVVTGKVEV